MPFAARHGKGALWPCLLRLWIEVYSFVVCTGVINVVFVLGGQCQQTTGVLGPWEISQVNHFLGILIRALADASHEQHSLSASQVILNVVGFCATVATTIFFTVYSKRQLKALQKEEELLLE
ncbi:hypothetical protein CK203_073299 [Vitis vinifera]|uniref:Uncharacterized protein n=1 Tax=Vitis vinifera TaxID=29760 RepID=A0A438ESN7_VITVI|nr:hypothetical protein CK203_073299 [Vitis vinifera]